MFGSTSKTPFGTGAFGTSGTSTFGSTQATPFGQATSGGLFGAKTQTTSAFGTPGFGSSTTPAFGGGTTSSGLFGASSNKGSLFSQPTTQQSTGFSFGQAKSGGLFGSTSQPSSLFQTPQPSTNVFGGGQSFGSTLGGGTSTASTGLFGSAFGPTTGTSATSGGVFGTASVFGGAGAASGTTVKFNPVTSSENVNKNGTSMVVQTKHQCISVMKEYETKSLEELRFEDYTAGRKSGSNTTSLFGASSQPQQATSSLFGSSTNSAFGQNKTSTFGGFGQPTTTTSSLFGQTAQTGGLFGSKPIGTGSIFGATTTTASTGFGTTGGLFGQTSATGPRFGGTGTSTGLFGGATGFSTAQTTSTGSLFGAGTSTFGQPQTGGLFGAAAKPFGLGTSGTSTFGTNTFGAGTSTGLFGSTATSKPAFSFNTAGTGGFGSSLGGFGGTTSLGTGGLFGSTGGASTAGSLFGGQAKTGLGTGFGVTTGFGSSLGGTSALGGTSFGGLGTGTSLTANQSIAGIGGANQASFAAFQQQQVLQQQLKALANSPFGDSPLFRNLTASRKRDEGISVTGPASKATTNASHYKVFSKPSVKVKLKPSPFPTSAKSKLFDGIDDDEGCADLSLTPRRSIKKLVIKNQNKSLLNGSVESSPLRLRSSTDDDHDDLIARVPSMPTAADMSTVDQLEFTEVVSAPVTEGRDGSQDEADITAVGIGNADNDSNSSEPGNPCGVILERPEYYTIPPKEDLNKLLDDEGNCFVENLVVGREDYGEVKFLGLTNVKDLNLDEIVFFRRREAEVYPDNYDGKPEVGNELNKKSEISLHKVWPNDKSSHTPIKTPERLKKSGFIERLEEKTSAMGALFLDYKPDTGTWVFQVEHFTRYGLNEQLFEDDGKQEIIMKKLKMAAEMKAEARRKDFEAEKERAMLEEQRLQKEKMMTMEAENSRTEERVDVEINDSNMEEQEDIQAPSPILGDACPEILGSTDRFSTSIQTAKISGVDPQRLQGMKALLFDDEEDEFMSPREKTLLGNKSLISASLRQTELRDRFQSPKIIQDGGDRLERSLLSESIPAMATPSRTVRKTKLLKTFNLAEEQAPYERVPPKDFHQELQPRIITATRHTCLTPRRLSNLTSREDQICDAALANGCRFRVGWASKLRLLHVGEPVGHLSGHQKTQTKEKASIFDTTGHRLQSEICADFAVRIEEIRIGGGADDHSYLVDCLKNNLKHSKIDTESADAPLIEPVDGIDALHSFAEMTREYKDQLGGVDETDIRYQHAIVWDLVKALWGRLDTKDPESLTAYQTRMHRRAAVSKWLSGVLEHPIKKEVDGAKDSGGHLDAIFSLLCGRQIREACKLACQNRDYRLTLLLSQASGDVQIKHMLREQLNEWKDQGADKFMNVKRLMIYQLLSGLMVWLYSHGDINVCENLEWKRSLALHLWYYCQTTSSVAKALQEYKSSYKGTDSYSAYAAPPKPCYAKNTRRMDDDCDDDSSSQPKDICYHLLRLFSKRSHRLEKLLCPNTHTSDPLDYQLCWELQQVLESLGYTHLAESYHCLIQSSFASQLETYGLWEWAVFILMHIKDHRRREVAVREMLSRHCHSSGTARKFSDKEALLVNSMKVPAKWIFEAKAQHARYTSKPYDEAVYLLNAGHWNVAHQTIIKELSSDAIIDEDYPILKELLLELSLPERSCTIKQWAQGGQVFLDYVLLREKLLQIEKGDVVVTAYNLEDLRGDVTSLISRISSMKADSPKERLAQAEMGRTSSNLLKIVLSELAEQGHQMEEDEEEVADKKYTWSKFQAAPYIAALPLPPEYIQQELEELVSSTGDEN